LPCDKKITQGKRKRNKKNEIIRAAEQVFAAGGYHGTTMAQISQASEYPLGTIYKFFSGKEQIYHDLVLSKGIELGEILIGITKTGKHRLKAG
jgi:AcrR family transcriptional regulator